MRMPFRLVIDSVVLSVFIVAMRPAVTGLSVHEWLSVSVFVPAFVHLIVNWNWVVRTSKRFVSRLATTPSLNLAVDAALFVATVTVMLSGLMVSRVVAPALGLHAASSLLWHQVHAASANVTFVLTVAHGALHLSWIKRALGLDEADETRPQAPSVPGVSALGGSDVVAD